MSKQGMKHEYHEENHSVPSVSQIQGKAKHGKVEANPIIAGTQSPALKVYHSKPHSEEKPIPSVYSEIDNDLARDNLENDLSAADLQDL